MKAAQDAASKACTAKITFTAKPLSSLKKGSCDTFATDPVYTQAVKKCDSATKKKIQASGSLEAAKKGLKDAKEAAEKEKKKCQCKAQAARATAVAKEKTASDTNAKAWTKAYHMLCVLEDKKTCTVPTLPKVEVPALAPGVSDANCKA